MHLRRGSCNENISEHFQAVWPLICLFFFVAVVSRVNALMQHEVFTAINLLWTGLRTEQPFNMLSSARTFFIIIQHFSMCVQFKFRLVIRYLPSCHDIYNFQFNLKLQFERKRKWMQTVDWPFFESPNLERIYMSHNDQEAVWAHT